MKSRLNALLTLPVGILYCHITFVDNLQVLATCIILEIGSRIYPRHKHLFTFFAKMQFLKPLYRDKTFCLPHKVGKWKITALVQLLRSS